MSKAALKKALASMPEQELRNLILDTYSVSKEARDYLEYWLNPDPKQLFEKFYKKLNGVFFTSSDKYKRKPKLTEANRIVKSFASISGDPHSIADLMLRYPEIMIRWLQATWKLHSMAAAVIRNIDAARRYIEAAGLEDEFADRLTLLSKAETNLQKYV